MEQGTETQVHSIWYQIECAKSSGININGKEVLTTFNFKDCTSPNVDSKQSLYELLDSYGLNNEAPLFIALFEKFGSGLRIQRPNR